MRFLAALVLFAGLAASPPGSTTTQSHPRPDALPLIGTWQLNLDRTHYGPGVDRRRRETMVCEADGPTVRCVIRSVRAGGLDVTGRFTASLTGNDAAVTGIPDIDAVRLRQPSTSLVDATFLFRGKPVYAYRAFQADDGQSLLIVSVDPITRAALTSVVVYDRAAAAGGAAARDGR
jgi:hypothetical protein